MTSVKARQKQESRGHILKAASHLFREKGVHATGIDEVMGKAGLTAGAFYAHFESKQDLFLEVLRYSLDRNRERLLKGTENLSGDQLVATVLGRYVSELHRDNPKAGCPLAAVGSEIHRSPAHTKEIVTGYLQDWSKILESTGILDRAGSLRILSQAVGAILLSRMVDQPLSNEILKAAKKVSLS